MGEYLPSSLLHERVLEDEVPRNGMSEHSNKENTDLEEDFLKYNISSSREKAK